MKWESPEDRSNLVILKLTLCQPDMLCVYFSLGPLFRLLDGNPEEV